MIALRPLYIQFPLYDTLLGRAMTTEVVIGVEMRTCVPGGWFNRGHTITSGLLSNTERADVRTIGANISSCISHYVYDVRRARHRHAFIWAPVLCDSVISASSSSCT